MPDTRPTPPLPVSPYFPSTEDFGLELRWDDFERRIGHYEYAQEGFSEAGQRLLHWIGSIHQCGYTREKCLRELIANYQPGDENRILLRLSDWVTVIQRLARTWTLEHFKLLPLEAIRANERLLLYLACKERLQDDPGLKEIKRDLLERTASIGRDQFFGFPKRFRKFLYSLSLAGEGYLRRWILDDVEPSNRLHLLKEIEFSHLTKEEVEKLGADKSVFVRRRFFHTQIEAGINPSRAQLLSLALDPNRSLRDLGQFYLNSIYSEDAYSIYRSREGAQFFYIADYGRKEDAGYFLEGLRTGSKATRYNCLRALAMHVPEHLAELELGTLISQDRKSRAVLLPVLPRLLSLDAILALRPAFEQSSRSGILSFLRLLEKKSFWTFVDTGLDVLLSDALPTSHEAIIRAIHQRVSIHEALPPSLRQSISAKIGKMRSAYGHQHELTINVLELMMKAP